MHSRETRRRNVEVSLELVLGSDLFVGERILLDVGRDDELPWFAVGSRGAHGLGLQLFSSTTSLANIGHLIDHADSIASSFVALERSIMLEASLAQVALEGSLATVEALVGAKRSLLTEGLSTRFAGKRFLSGVCTLVADDGGLAVV